MSATTPPESDPLAGLSDHQKKLVAYGCKRPLNGNNISTNTYGDVVEQCLSCGCVTHFGINRKLATLPLDTYCAGYKRLNAETK